jgi:hypothetical protein
MNHIQDFQYRVTYWVLVQISSSAQYVSLETYFSHPSLVILVYEQFLQKLNYFLFCWIFEKIFITCVKIIYKIKNMQVFHCWVELQTFKVQ